jgi:hypothetical protein
MDAAAQREQRCHPGPQKVGRTLSILLSATRPRPGRDELWDAAGVRCSGAHPAAVPISSSHDSNLVDSASSHTLVSKIKPCTSENKEFSLNLRMAHYISYSLFDSPFTRITGVILWLIRAQSPDFWKGCIY